VIYSYTDPRGCVLNNEPLSLEVGAPKFVEIAPIDDLCTSSPAFELVGSGYGQWSGAVNGEGSSIQIDPASLGPGSWSVTLTVSPIDECPGSATRDFIVDVCAGVEQLHALEPSLHPNPFLEATTVAIPWVGPVEIAVYDASGRAVPVRLSNLTDGQRTMVDLAGVAPGLYTIDVRAGGQHYRLKAVKER
jgi:hypothetical protein